MFTGIIENLATIERIIPDGSNLHFEISSPIAGELKTDQSVAHNGVCLTVVSINGTSYRVTAIAETLAKTNLGSLQAGDQLNIERALIAGARLDGHFVQGHVDCTGVCTEKITLEGSWQYSFRFPGQFAPLVIEKGSICVNGVSLTAFNAGRDTFTVAIIPYTFEHTTFNTLRVGSIVNLEFDILGKYLLRLEELKMPA